MDVGSDICLNCHKFIMFYPVYKNNRVFPINLCSIFAVKNAEMFMVYASPTSSFRLNGLDKITDLVPFSGRGEVLGSAVAW